MKYQQIIDSDLRLEPLDERFVSVLAEAAGHSDIWAHNPGIRRPQEFRDVWIPAAFAAKELGQRWPYVIHFRDECVGSTSFYEVSLKHRKTSIGYTWLHPRCWGTGLNGRLKDMMLRYAFESGMHRVSFHIDTENLRSIKAVEKLGAQREGVLRRHMIRSDGSFRDTAVYSLLSTEYLST